MKEHQWKEIFNTGASKIFKCIQCDAQIGVGLNDTPTSINTKGFTPHLLSVMNEDCDLKIAKEIMTR